MTYTTRLANSNDVTTIAPLWESFAQEWAAADDSMVIKPNFDFEKYIAYQLTKSLTYGWVLEHQDHEQSTIIGCLLIYFYDEAPLPNLPPDLLAAYELENPFQPRRIGSVLSLYVQPKHRKPHAIQQLAIAALHHAEQLQVTDLDILMSIDQGFVHSLLKDNGFEQSALQFTRRYTIPTDTALPNLHPLAAISNAPTLPSPDAIPLRDPKTHELIHNPHGQPFFLNALQNEIGEILRDSAGLAIYPIPLRDPQTHAIVFDTSGEPVLCPPLKDDRGNIIEYAGIPQFHPAQYDRQILKQDVDGNYVFC
jgi:hypothetical protein